MNYCYKMKHKLLKGSSQGFSPEVERERASKKTESDYSIKLRRYTPTGSIKTPQTSDNASSRLFEMNSKSNIIRHFYEKTRRHKSNASKKNNDDPDVIFKPRSYDLETTTNSDYSRTPTSSNRTVIVHSDPTDIAAFPIFECEYGQSVQLGDNPLLFENESGNTCHNLAYQSDSQEEHKERFVSPRKDSKCNSPNEKSKSQPRRRRSKSRTKRSCRTDGEVINEMKIDIYHSDSDEANDANKHCSKKKHRPKKKRSEVIGDKHLQVSPQSRMTGYYQSETVLNTPESIYCDPHSITDEPIFNRSHRCEWIDETVSNNIPKLGLDKEQTELNVNAQSCTIDKIVESGDADDDAYLSSMQGEELQKEAIYQMVLIKQRDSVVCSSASSPTIFISGTNSPNDDKSPPTDSFKESINPQFSDHMDSLGQPLSDNECTIPPEKFLYSETRLADSDRIKFMTSLIDQLGKPATLSNADDTDFDGEHYQSQNNIMAKESCITNIEIQNSVSVLPLINGNDNSNKSRSEEVTILQSTVACDENVKSCSLSKPCDVKKSRYSWVDDYWQCSGSSLASSDVSERDLSLLSASFPAMLWKDWTSRNVRIRLSRIKFIALISPYIKMTTDFLICVKLTLVVFCR